ncbi:MAG: lipopolysaccharide assembly protein LapA domain-containing protein [Candidatus Puniceispirillaceae bacterium]
MSALRQFFWIMISLIFFAYCAFFAIANHDVTSVSFWPVGAGIEMPLWLAVFVGFAAGMIITALAASLRVSQLRLKLFSLQRRYDKQMQHNHDHIQIENDAE